MALTAQEEALVRQLLNQQAAILSLAGNEATITSKLGATKVTLADLVAASSLADADLLLTRQGTTDKSVTAKKLAEYIASQVGIPTAVADGTADAITADFTPNVSLTNGTTVIVRASAANTTTAPTFAPDGLTAKTIVKGNNLALVAGDIAGAGHWLVMNFDTVLGKWVLQNPATGIAATATKLQTARTINGTSFDGSANITTANWGTARTLTIGNTGKSVDGSANVSWSLAEVVGAGVPDTATVLESGVDLNTINTPGFYLQPLVVNAASGTNYPMASAGALVVLRNAGGVSQLYYTYGSATTAPLAFFRALYEGSWSTWREFYHSGNLGAATESSAGLIELATAAEAQALASAVVALTPARLADAFKGANQSTLETGFQKLPGGLILQWGKIAEASRGIGDIAFPITFPLAFPNAILNAGATVRPGDAVAIGYIDGWATVRNTSNSSMDIIACASTGGTIVYGIYWFAIGY